MLLTAAIAVPLILSTVFDATLDDRGIVDDAGSLSTGGEVVARADLPSHTFLVVRNDETAPVTLALTTYERLPFGRFYTHRMERPDRRGPFCVCLLHH